MSEQHYLTEEGAQRLREELKELKGPARKELAQRLRSAIEMGDLSENADYHKAKEDQAFLEGRIQELEYLLSNAEIIETNGKADKVDLGVTVTIQEEDYPPETYQMVGATEADPRNGRISHQSPFGQALMGAKEGDEVVANSPAGEVHLKVLKIH
jgi:transcription elongation factor GreA